MCVVPLPKTSASESYIMKAFERVILVHHKKMDSFQFADRKNTSVDDVILHVLMFHNFSSAFNTIQRHFLSEKRLNSNGNESTVMWILYYLIRNCPLFFQSAIKAQI